MLERLYHCFLSVPGLGLGLQSCTKLVVVKSSPSGLPPAWTLFSSKLHSQNHLLRFQGLRVTVQLSMVEQRSQSLTCSGLSTPRSHSLDLRCHQSALPSPQIAPVNPLYHYRWAHTISLVPQVRNELSALEALSSIKPYPYFLHPVCLSTFLFKFFPRLTCRILTKPARATVRIRPRTTRLWFWKLNGIFTSLFTRHSSSPLIDHPTRRRWPKKRIEPRYHQK